MTGGEDGTARLTAPRDAVTGRPAGTAARPAVRAGEKTPPDRLTRVLGWSAAAAIAGAVVIMIAVSAAGPSAGVASMPKPAAGPPWWLSLRLGAGHVTVALWAAEVIGVAGVAAGLAAVARGARPPARWLVAGALAAAAVFAVLPPAGSTDEISYAIDGRIAATGHNPYVMTPGQLRKTGDPIARLAPPTWLNAASVYGPLATAEEWAAAELGGTSAARITFWLKLWNVLAFGAVVLALDRALRSDPARRARAHLLWSVNPLVLWAMAAGGHIDGVATALGFCGLLVLRPGQPGQPGRAGGGTSVARAFAAGLLTGAATACKVTFGVFGLGVMWQSRRSAPALAGAVTGFLVALVPGYAIAGWPAVKVLAARTQGATWDNFYQFFYRPFGVAASQTSAPAALMVLAVILTVGLAALTLWRLPGPGGRADGPAVRIALALSLAWLFAWPFQRPWYDVMVICLVALYPASRLDGVILIRLLAGTTVFTLARDQTLAPHLLNTVFMDNVSYLTPAIRLAAVVALVWLCLSGAWRWQPEPGAWPEAGLAGRLPCVATWHSL
jgi:hypothetical protein